jgi:anthranilate phosphoribosyltransferase
MNADDIRFREFVRTVGRGEKRARPLNFEDARDAMGLILDGRADPQQSAAFLLACRMKGEDPVELAGFTAALQQRCQLLQVDARQLQHCVTVGHPYDGREDTFIMGAGATIVAAAGGATVVLHGAPKVPAKHAPGVAEVLAALNIPVYLAPDTAASFVAQHRLVHVDTRAFVPAWVPQLELREKIGLRLPFSTIEKLLDPARSGNLIVGIAHGPYLAKISGALQRLNVPRGLIVQGLEGSCDLSPQHPARIAVVLPPGSASSADEIAVDPKALGLNAALDVRAIGADPAKSAQLTQAAFSGSTDPDAQAAAEAIALNAGLLLWRAGICVDLKAGFERARELITGGEAKKAISTFG